MSEPFVYDPYVPLGRSGPIRPLPRPAYVQHEYEPAAPVKLPWTWYARTAPALVWEVGINILRLLVAVVVPRVRRAWHRRPSWFF